MRVRKPINIVVTARYCLQFCLSSTLDFYSRIPHDLSYCMNKTICVLQRRSSTRTTRRRPYIMTPMRMQMPETPNLTMASWSSTDPYVPPGASSLWSVIILTSLSPLCYIQDANKYHVRSVQTVPVSVYGALECLCSEECCHIQFGHSPYPSSHFLCPSCCLSGSTGAFLLVLGWAGGRQSARPSESLASTAGPNAIMLASSSYSSD